jgi:hypothetical protein
MSRRWQAATWMAFAAARRGGRAVADSLFAAEPRPSRNALPEPSWSSTTGQIADSATVGRSGRTSRHGEPAMRNMRPAGDMQNLTLGHANPDPDSFCMTHMPQMTRSPRTVASVRFCMNASASAAPARRTLTRLRVRRPSRVRSAHELTNRGINHLRPASPHQPDRVVRRRCRRHEVRDDHSGEHDRHDPHQPPEHHVYRGPIHE